MTTEERATWADALRVAKNVGFLMWLTCLLTGIPPREVARMFAVVIRHPWTWGEE